MEENEIWKDIIGFPNYQISNFGNVKSLNYNHTGKEQILKLTLGNDGYLRINLRKNGKPKHILVHRLVANAFIPNDDLFKTQINHINEIKTDNRVNNLEWCTAQYNTEYSQAKQVNQYDLNDNFIKTWKSTMEIEKQLGFANQSISDCCNGKPYHKTAYGFIWKYVE